MGSVFEPVLDSIDVVMGRVLASSAIDSRFEPRSGQTKDYKIGICCFSAKHAVLRSKSKDGLTRNKDNVFRVDRVTCLHIDCCFCWANTIKIQLPVVQNNHYLIEMQLVLAMM